MAVGTNRNESDERSISKDFFLARQPILNRNQQQIACELLFRSAHSGAADVTDDMYATASVLAHVAELGLEQVVGNMLGFVNVDANVLFSDFINFLPCNKVILEILETVEATPEVIARVLEMKRAGFKFALDDVVANSADVKALQPLVDVVKVDIMGMSPRDLSSLARVLKLSGKKLLAEKVETVEEFELCLSLGFDYFQGYYFAKPVILSGKKLAPSELVIIQLLSLLDSDADNAAIEQQIKHDALISINLLRLVNTPAAGTMVRIDSLSQALMVLGRRQLQRWLQILLYAKADKGGGFASPLLALATTRAKLLELMAEALQPRQRGFSDAAFSVGVMSLMDTLFAIPMAELLSKISVADEVGGALLGRDGVYGNMLKVVESSERGDDAGMLLSALQALDLNADEFYALQLRAFEWSHKIAQTK